MNTLLHVSHSQCVCFGFSASSALRLCDSRWYVIFDLCLKRCGQPSVITCITTTFMVLLLTVQLESRFSMLSRQSCIFYITDIQLIHMYALLILLFVMVPYTVNFLNFCLTYGTGKWLLICVFSHMIPES